MGKVHVFKNYFFNKTITLSFTLQESRQMNPVDMIYNKRLLTQAVLVLNKLIRLGLLGLLNASG
jgi:hypothetical protein